MKKDKFHKECGVILNRCEIKIDKGTKKVIYRHTEYIVIVSDEKQYCVKNGSGILQLIEKNYSKYSSKTALNKVSTYEQKWHSSYFDDYLISSCVSTFSEKVTKNRVKKALLAFIAKEAYFYNGLSSEIEFQLNNQIAIG